MTSPVESAAKSGAKSEQESANARAAASKRVAVPEQVSKHQSGNASRRQLIAGLAHVDLLVRYAVARARAHGLDPDDEFRGLYISEEQIDSLLGNDLGSLWPHPNGHPMAGADEWTDLLQEARSQWAIIVGRQPENGNPLLLSRLIHSFNLQPVEVDLFLIALAPEIDPRYERLFAYLQDDVTKKRPSVDLLLNLLTESFDQKLELRRLLTDSGRLLRSRLLVRFSEGATREPTLLGQYLKPPGRVVEHLLGQPGLDDKLSDIAGLSFPTDSVPWLAKELVERLDLVTKEAGDGRQYPFFSFTGGYGVGKRAAAEYLASTLGRPLITVDMVALGKSDLNLSEALSIVGRDGRLLEAILYFTGWDSILEDGRLPENVFHQLLTYPGIVITSGQTNWQPEGRQRSRLLFQLPFDAADYGQRLALWKHYLQIDELKQGGSELSLLQLSNQFQFSPGQIEDVVGTARDFAAWRQEPLSAQDLNAASRAHSNQKLVALATKITPRYRWQDIVLPEDTLLQLREMVNTVRQRPTVYDQWGFDRKVALGKGLSSLFAGESGTGKTMAADIIAGDLGQDLYKIDLSMLVSKYIGETEKNLNRVFTEAETSNAILFFDEADAIFGKRSEVKDSHDRYANIEISYLLQRMETYDGVVILASNLRGNLDEAFTRRLHFIVEFPFPEAVDREIIWKVNFPPETPIAKDVDFRLLARRFRITGGNIRNIIMAAAFLAAEDSEQVGMTHLLHATRREYQKIGRLIDEELFVMDD
jgi:AAA+ superfamily predicted ATPase